MREAALFYTSSKEKSLSLNLEKSIAFALNGFLLQGSYRNFRQLSSSPRIPRLLHIMVPSAIFAPQVQ